MPGDADHGLFSGMNVPRLTLTVLCLVCAAAAQGCRTGSSTASANGARRVEGDTKPSLLAFQSVPAQSEPEIHPTSGTANDSAPDAKPTKRDRVVAAGPHKSNEGNLLTRWFVPQGKGQKPKRMPLPLSEQRGADREKPPLEDF